MNILECRDNAAGVEHGRALNEAAESGSADEVHFLVNVSPKLATLHDLHQHEQLVLVHEGLIKLKNKRVLTLEQDVLTDAACGSSYR